MGEEGRDEEVASSKRKTKLKTRVQNIDTLFKTKMAKIDTLFMTKTAEKPYPLGPHIPI